jgi:hypothetical protein
MGRLYISGVHEQNMQCSCAFPPICCLSVPRNFLTAHMQPPILAYAVAKAGSVGYLENSQPVTS